jgi:hypothetical protein
VEGPEAVEDHDTTNWNPATFAIHKGNLDVIKEIIGPKTLCYNKKLIRVPSMLDT